MDNVFAITTAATDIKADAGGKASAVFTVTNSSSRPIRGMAKAKALGNTQQEWLNVEGETERDFSAGGTQQYTVNFSKPPGSPPSPGAPAPPPEKLPFRLDVASCSNPDEVFTEGPAVNVEVKEAPLPVKKAFPWWIIAIIAGALLILTLILIFVIRGCSGGKPPANNSNSVQATSFAGSWRPDNADPSYTFVARMDVLQDGKQVRVKLLCQFITCDDWEYGQGEIVGDSATVVWKNNAVTGKIKITLLEPTRLIAEGDFQPSRSGMLKPSLKAVFLKNNPVIY